MTCAEFKERVAALALGAVTAAEAAELEAHLRQPGPHAGCHEEARTMADAASLLAVALPPVTPPPHLWQSIAARVAPPRPPRRRAVWPVAATMAALAALVLVVLLARDRERLTLALTAAEQRAGSGERQHAQCLAELEKLRADDKLRAEAIALLRLPGTRTIRMQAQGGHPASAHVILNAADHRAILVGDGLRAKAGGDYQLWVIRGDRKISAGLLRGDDGGKLLTAIDPALLAEAPPDAFAVTVEPLGGVAAPSGPIVLLGAI